jgi:hypothetical protein
MKPLVLPLALTLLASAFVVGCGRESGQADVENPTVYSKDGLRFKMPGNWHVSEDDAGEAVRSVSVNEPGHALLLIHIFPVQLAPELQVWARRFAKHTRDNARTDSVSNSVFGSVGAEGGFEMLSETFSVTHWGATTPHTREYRKRGFGKQVCLVLTQVSDEDRPRVSAGFQQVTGSLEYASP